MVLAVGLLYFAVATIELQRTRLALEFNELNFHAKTRHAYCLELLKQLHTMDLLAFLQAASQLECCNISVESSTPSKFINDITLMEP